MAMTTSIRAAALLALVLGAGLAPSVPVAAADKRMPVIQVAASEATSRFIPLGIGKSVAIDLPADIKDVLVADPKIANAVIRSSRRVYMIGVAIGQTNIFFFDAEGKQIAGFDIAVTRDLNGVRAALKQTMPDADIHIEGVGDGIMLSGTAASAAESQQAYDLASRLVGDGTKVVNGISVRGRDQVMLKVTVAEVRRDVIKQLGIDLSGTFNYGSAVVNLNTQNPFSATGQTLSNTAFTGQFNNVTATLRAMDRAGVLRTLAEPNLTAISGETASFVAGGEFPIPNGLSCDTTKSPPICQPQIDFKKFGVSLVFTPVVLSEGRISLKVMTEVSDLSTDNALTLAVPGSTQTLTVPSISTRRAETTVEIPSGGSLALAGMIQQKTKQQINGVPGLMQLPVLGSLFQEPRLHQQPDRIDGSGHALCGACGGAEAAGAARRRLLRSQRSVDRVARASQPHLRRRQGRRAAERIPRQIRIHSRLSGMRRRSMTGLLTTIVKRRSATALRALAVVGLATSLAGCYTQHVTQQAAYPDDYHERHPITLKEREHTVEVFVGRNRGGLTPKSARRRAFVRTAVAPRGHQRHHRRCSARPIDRARRSRFDARSAIYSRRGRCAAKRDLCAYLQSVGSHARQHQA